MVRKTAVVLSTLFLFVATEVFALGLGSITLDSALNQPLRARIQILDLGNVDPSDITVVLASSQDFSRFNVDRSTFLNNIRFDIEETANGVFVNLSTTQAVREPFLSLILDTRWPSGRLLSEHTVLLDLPVFDNGGATPAVGQPVSPVLQPPVNNVPPQPTTNRAGTSSPSTTANTADPVSGPGAGAGISASSPAIPGTIETQASDTLWEIALEVRPDSSVSVQQTMLAIQRMNPDAFIDGNINRLRSGQVLRVPDLSDIQSVDQQAAVSEVVRQNDSANIQIEPLVAPAGGPATAAQSDQQGQLSVVTASEVEPDTSAASGAASADAENLDSRIQALENQLVLQEEQADLARIQRQELMGRLGDLETQIASAVELLTLQDQQLAQLQSSIAEAQGEVETEAVTPAAAPQTQQPTSLLDSIIQSLTNASTLLIAIAAVVVLLMVILLIRRGRVTETGFDDELDELVDSEEFEIPEKQTNNQFRSNVAEDDDAYDEVSQFLNVNEEHQDDSDDISDADVDDYDGDIDEDESDDDTDDEISKMDNKVIQEAEAEKADESTSTETDDDIDDFEDELDFDLDEIEGFDDIDEEGNIRETSEADSLDFDLDNLDGPESKDKVKDPADFTDPGPDGANLIVADVDDDSDKAEEVESVVFSTDDSDSLPAKASAEDEVEPETAEAEKAEFDGIDFSVEDASSTADDAGETESEDTADEEKAEQDHGLDYNLEPDMQQANEDDSDTESSDSEDAQKKTGDAAADYTSIEFDLEDAEATMEKSEEKVPDTETAASDDNALDFNLDEGSDDETEEDKDLSKLVSQDKQAVESETAKLDDLEFLAADKDGNYLNIDDDMEGDADILSSDDEAATKLDLAYAYQKMGDVDGAREILEEVLKEGNDSQVSEARDLMGSLVK